MRRLYKNQPSGTVAALRAARRNPTQAETALLRALREALPQHKWRFQAPIGPFRVDFMCLAERLVIEVDGATHAEAESYDASRTAFIEAEGFRVLRFWNNDVLGNTEGVIDTIRNSLSLRERSAGSTAPRAVEARPGAGPTQHWARDAQGRGKGEGDQAGKTRQRR